MTTRSKLVGIAVALIIAIVGTLAVLRSPTDRIPSPSHSGPKPDTLVDWGSWLFFQIDRTGYHRGDDRLDAEEVGARVTAYGKDSMRIRDADGIPVVCVYLQVQTDTPWSLVQRAIETCADGKTRHILLRIPRPAVDAEERSRYSGNLEPARQLAVAIYPRPVPGAITWPADADSSRPDGDPEPVTTVSLFLLDPAGNRIDRPARGTTVGIEIDGQRFGDLDQATEHMKSNRKTDRAIIDAARNVPFEWVFEVYGIVEWYFNGPVFFASPGQ